MMFVVFSIEKVVKSYLKENKLFYVNGVKDSLILLCNAKVISKKVFDKIAKKLRSLKWDENLNGWTDEKGKLVYLWKNGEVVRK